MRKYIKNNILEIFETLHEAHEIIAKYIDNKKFDNACNLLADCQDTATQLYSIIEETEGEEFVTLSLINEYYEELFNIASNLSEKSNGCNVKNRLNKKIDKAEVSARNDIKVRLEIVFLPYKASMWDSLESVWKAADEDPDCDAYVVPIPYFDRKPDHSFGEFHYEGDQYPDYVPVVHYNAYNLKQRRPDVIFIHNPYDGNNFVTSVHPNFYSSALKQYTDNLAYCEYGIPIWIFKKPTPYDVFINGWFNVDLFFTYSKEYAINQRYAMLKVAPKLKIDIVPLGSPKFDKVINSKKEDYEIPDEWKKIIDRKKVVLFNTSLGTMLKDTESYLNKLHDVLDFFKNSENIALWWRPHPLSETTLASMRPNTVKKYMNIIEAYKSQGWGIYDESSDVHRAIVFTDAYYGDESSLVYLYLASGKPLTITGNPHLTDHFTANKDSFEWTLQWRIHCMCNANGANIDNYNICVWWGVFYESQDYKKFLELYLDYVKNKDKYPLSSLYEELQMKMYRDYVINSNGTAGAEIYKYCKNKVLKGDKTQ